MSTSLLSHAFGIQGYRYVRTAYVAGNTIFSSGGTLNLGPNAGNGFMQTGDGNLIIHGLITGGAVNQPNLYRFAQAALGGTTVLTNWNNNFASDFRMDGGTVRISHGGELGGATAAGNPSKLRGSNTAGFEIRTDVPGSFSNIRLDGPAWRKIWASRASSSASRPPLISSRSATAKCV